MLTPNPNLATAVVRVLASFLMRRIGRRMGFLIGGLLIGGLAGLMEGSVAVLAISVGSFAILCRLRFDRRIQGLRALLSVRGGRSRDGQRLKARAISLVFIGSFIEAFVGPRVGAHARDALRALPFAGSFLVIAVMGILTILAALALRLPEDTARPERLGSTGRSRAVLARQPDFVAAVVTCTLGYAAMAFIMQAAPIAVVAAGHPVMDVAFVMRMHFAGM